MTDRVFDPGLQPERTLLAWRRTCLSFALASLIAMRFTVDPFDAVAVIAGLLGAGLAVDPFDAVAVIAGLLGAGLAVAAFFTAAAGYRRAHDALHRTGNLEHGAWPMALACAGALALGAVCALFLVSGAGAG